MNREQFEIIKRNLRDSIDHEEHRHNIKIAEAKKYLEGYREAIWDAFSEFEKAIELEGVDE